MTTGFEALASAMNRLMLFSKNSAPNATLADATTAVTFSVSREDRNIVMKALCRSRAAGAINPMTVGQMTDVC